MSYALEGKTRSRLREAVLAGFSPETLDQILRDNDMFKPNVASGPNFTARVNSLIDVAYQEGWLIDLCGVLASERAGNFAVASAITSVQKQLLDQRSHRTSETAVVDDQDGGIPESDIVRRLPKFAQSRSHLLWMLGLIIVAVGGTVYLVSKTTHQAPVSDAGLKTPEVSRVEARSGGVAVGGDVKGSVINIGPPSIPASNQQASAPTVPPGQKVSGSVRSSSVACTPDRRPATSEKCLNPKDTFKDCPECPEMVVVPTGFFIMGSPVNEKSRDENEGPQRKVTISSPLAIAKYEVTFAEWDACVNAGGCKHKPDDEGWGRGARPVINISWDDITGQYLPWLSDKAGATYRLLTEAEWEYAARATSETKFPFGDDDKALCSHANVADLTAHQRYSNWTAANCRDGFVNTAPVGSFVANAFGLHDMVGNVWEWVQDCYTGSYRGQPTDGSAASSGDCSKRALRGGAWIGHPSGVRSASRYWLSPETRDNAFGFRVVRTLDR